MVDFSANLLAYIAGRPFYPLPFFKEALAKAPRPNFRETMHIWDCATGPNAAVTIGLIEVLSDLRFQSPRFKHARVHIHATDIDEKIVDAAQSHFTEYFSNRGSHLQNIKVTFTQAAAEVGPRSLPKGKKLSLVLIGNALHWFDLKRFFATVQKNSKKGALLVAWTHQIVPRVHHRELQDALIAFDNELRPSESKQSQAFVSSGNGYHELHWPFADENFGPYTLVKFLTQNKLVDFWDSHFPRGNGKTLEKRLLSRIKSVWPAVISPEFKQPDLSIPLRFEWKMNIRAARIGSYKPSA